MNRVPFSVFVDSEPSISAGSQTPPVKKASEITDAVSELPERSG